MSRIVILAFTLALSTAAFPQTKTRSKKPPTKAAPIVGCVDQREDYYVLRKERMMQLLARLEPVGFDKTLLARYVGQKVSIPGPLAAEGDPPMLRITNIHQVKMIADNCAAGEQ